MARTAPTSFGTDKTHTDDLHRETLAPIETDADRETVIEPADRFMSDDQFRSAAFMEDMMTIRIERGRERNASMWASAAVNGAVQWIRVGVPQNVKRKFVEVLARSAPFSVNTEHGTTAEPDPHNRVVKSQFSQYPFSVLQDPNPLGHEWLQRVYMQN